jgi:hypothetical protein
MKEIQMNRISFRILGVLSLAAVTTLSATSQAPASSVNLSRGQLSTLASSAKTPADHERIAQYYQAKAQGYLAQAQVHQAMLAAYKANPALSNNKNQASTVGHCEYFVQSLQQQAAKAQQQAQSHELMAEVQPPAGLQEMASQQAAAAAQAQAKSQEMPGMDMSAAKAPAGAQPAGMKCMMMDKMASGAQADAKTDGMAGMDMKPAQPGVKPQGDDGKAVPATKPPCCCDGMKM